MKLSGLVVFAGLTAPWIAARAADAAAVDYAARNAPFAPDATMVPEKSSPQIDAAWQDKRVEPTTLDKPPAAIGDRRAAIDVSETRAKNVREKDTHRPEAIVEPTSGFNHRAAAISTAEDTKKPLLVTKYQESLTAASASNMARFPALGRATAAKINRFVFLRNGAEPAVAGPEGRPASVTPAGGTPALRN